MNPDLPFRTRIWLFLYGYPHMAGSALGLLGLGLYFGGIIGPGWPFIVAGCYGLGWLVAWQVIPAETHLEITREAHAEALLTELDALIARVKKRLPGEAATVLANLRATLADLLPRLSQSSVFSQEAHGVEQTVREYLPATLESYLRLPPMYARVHVMRNGKTALDQLRDQLGLLDERMQAMLDNALADDARALSENGVFLRSRFKPYDFFSVDGRA